MPQPIAGATPAAPETAAPEYYRWEVPGQPLAVEIRLDVVDRLDQELVQAFRAITSRGSEIGGLLLGRYHDSPGPTIVIEDYEKIACDYQRGPLYLLSEEDRRRFEQALAGYRGKPDAPLAPVGYFRSNTRKELALDDEDAGLVKQYFAGGPYVCLLVKPFASKANLAGFFLPEGGEPQRKSLLTFPFHRAELAKFAAPSVAPATPASPVRPGKPPIEVRISVAEATVLARQKGEEAAAAASASPGQPERKPPALDAQPAAPPLDGKAVPGEPVKPEQAVTPRAMDGKAPPAECVEPKESA
ncbi:MAG: hypothetical protein ACPL7M_10835, partial [Bryobacteraceae bacterium]